MTPKLAQSWALALLLLLLFLTAGRQDFNDLALFTNNKFSSSLRERHILKTHDINLDRLCC